MLIFIILLIYQIQYNSYTIYVLFLINIIKCYGSNIKLVLTFYNFNYINFILNKLAQYSNLSINKDS
jgi:hypothetical protein